MGERKELGQRAPAWRTRDMAGLVALAIWTILIVGLFPAPAPSPPAVPYSPVHSH